MLKSLFIVLLLVPISILSQVKLDNVSNWITREIIRNNDTSIQFNIAGNYASKDLLFVLKAGKDVSYPRLLQKGNYDSFTGLTATYTSYTTITVTFQAYETAGYGRNAYYCDITDLTTDTVTVLRCVLNISDAVRNMADGIYPPVGLYPTFWDTSAYDPGFPIMMNTGNTADIISLDSLKNLLSIDTNDVDANFDSLYTKTSHIVNVMDYVNSYDTTGNWQPAIQAAINSLEPLIGLRAYGSASFGTVGVVILPAMTMEIDSSVKLYSGITLQGQGFSSELKEGSGFVGEQLISLYGKSNVVDNVKIKDLQLTSTTVRAIGYDNVVAGYMVNSLFEGLVLNSAQGIILDEYTQATVIRDIYSYGAVDTILFLYGNFNYVENIDKEGNTGSSVGAYIYLRDLTGTGSSCNGNELKNILIEGGTSVNKSGIIINNVGHVTIDNYWYEPNFSDGYMLRVGGAQRVHIKGFFQIPYPNSGKLKIDSTGIVIIENYTAGSAVVPLDSLIEKDSMSVVQFTNYQDRGIYNPYRLEELLNNFQFGNVISNNLSVAPKLGYSPTQHLIYTSGSNWLINGSFEAGQYQWTTTADTVSVISSEVDKGLMLRVLWNDTTNGDVLQNITISSEFVGRILTFSALVNVTEGNEAGFVYPYINGCGISVSNGYNRAYLGSGWQVITQTIEPYSAGTLTIGIGGSNITEYYIDNANLSIGAETILNSDRTGSLELNNNSITYASSAPTTGTWKQGDIVFNNGTGDEDYVGWVCTSAGTPGTWYQFGGTIETRGGFYEKAITITPTNSTSYALTVNNTMKVSGYTYGYHELMVPLLNMTVDDSIPIIYTTVERIIDSIKYKMDDSTCFNIKYGTDGYGTEIFTTPDTLTGGGTITSFDNATISADNEMQLYFPYFGDTAVKQWIKIYYHDYDTVNVYAADLNGANESMTKATPTGMDITGVGSEFTVMGWFKSPDVTHDNVDIARRQNTYDSWQVGKNTDGKPYFFMYENSPVSQIYCAASSAVTDSTWYHFAVTISTDSTRIYVNGVRQYGAGTTYPPLVADVNDAPNLTIGGWSSTGGTPNTQNSNSAIGEIQIINGYALTQAEITNAYNLTYAGSHYPSSYLGGTVCAWYKWSGEDDAVFLEDATGTGNDLTGNNVDRAGDQVIINGGYK